MLNYKKASTILEQVAEELNSYDEQGLIDNSKLYKILRTCNATLGIRLNPEKQVMVRVNNFHAPTPSDYEALNFAFLCHKKKLNVTRPHGFHVEIKSFQEWQPKDNSCCIFERETETVIVQKCKEEWQEFSHFDMVRITDSTKCSDNCMNVLSRSSNSVSINKNDIVTDFKEGDLYLNYVGAMEDEDGDLLVLDHPLTEPYYEAAVIHHLFKLLLRNKEADVAQLYTESLRALQRAKIDALNFTNMPEYTELRDLYQAQRVRLWRKYALPIVGWS